MKIASRELQNEEFLAIAEFEPSTFRLRSERATTVLRSLISISIGYITLRDFTCAVFVIEIYLVNLARGKCNKIICRLFLTYTICIVLLLDQLRRLLTVKILQNVIQDKLFSYCYIYHVLQLNF